MKTRFRGRIVAAFFVAFSVSVTNVNITPASALTGLNLEVDYTPDSATVATSVQRGSKIDLTASTPVAVAGTTEQEIIQQIDPELNLRSTSDITAPSGWSIFYSSDGNVWTSTSPSNLAGWEALRFVKAKGPLVSEGADSSGRQISSTTASGLQPDSGQFSTANDASGDGWDVFFDDMKHVYNVWHHRTGTGIDCHLRTGARCDGSWPYQLKSATNYNPSIAGTFEMAGSYNSTGWYDSVDKEIWIPTVYTRGISGVANSSVGFACISVADITATNKWCGGSVTNGGFVSPGAGADFLTSQKCSDSLYDCYQGLAASGSRIFTWAVKTGDLACVDIRLNNGAGGPCSSGGLIDFGASLPDAGTGGFWYSTLGAWDGRIYGGVNDTNSAGYGVCIDASTGAACTGWTNPRANLGGESRFTTLPGLANGDPMRAACFIGIGNGIATRVNCYDASGNDISGTLTQEFLTNYKTVGMGAYSNYNPAYGTRMYWGAGSASAGSGIHCWDFALNNWCANWTSAGISDTNYQISLDPMKPTCIWSNADDTIIQTYNATTGTAGNCAMPAPTVNFDGGMQLPRMACSSQNAIQAWRSFTLVTAVSYSSATFTVKNSSGTAIPSWTNVTIPGNKIIDLSNLTIADTGQTPMFSVTFTGRTDEGDVSARISAIGGSPELCLRPTIACPSPIVHPNQLLANTVSVTASASTTANSVVSQFDPVTRTVNIASTPTTTCATSLSGNLSTGAGAAVSGVLVTLTDTSGTALTYPLDYPEVALRGTTVTATSDSSGNYSFPLVAAGDYKLKFVDASGTVLVNQAIVTASGSGMTTDYTAATSLLSPAFTLVTGTAGVVNAKYNSSQSLSKTFWPTTVNAGQVTTLTFTISNTALAAKTGIGWVDSLPSGLVVDDNPNKRTTCPGGSSESLNPTSMTAVAGSATITVTNASVNANVASCTYSVNVKATATGDYRNGPTNVTTTAIDKNTDASVEVLAPPTTGATLCDNNAFYLDGGQLYRQDLSTQRRYAVGPTYTSGVVDAMGYNTLDGFIYGIARSTATSNGITVTAGHLVRYSSAGILTDLGAMSGTGITDTVMATAVAGDFDLSGNLVVKATGSKTTLYSINVSTRVVTTITTSSAIQGDDLAFAKGYFYSQSGMSVYKVAASAGTNWTASSVQIFPNYAASPTAYSDGLGQVIFVEASARGAYQISNPLTAASTSDVVLKFSYTSTPLDGAMCHAAPVPVANPDTSSAGKNVIQTKNLLTNDDVATNAPEVSLIASSVKLCDPNSNPAETSPNCTKGPGSTITVANIGTYSVDANGVVTFTPVLDYLGTPPALNYQVTDSIGNIATSTYTPTVLNTVPSATNDTSSGAYDANQIISPLTNDTAGSLAAIDPTSVKLCATTNTANASCNLTTLEVPGEGTYTVNANGTVTFDPLPTFTGTASPVKYVVADTMNQLTNATITPLVSTPTAPSATPQSKSVIPGGTISFTTLTGTNGLATTVAAFSSSLTCLITPGSSPATCDADGIVTIAGEGTYTLNTSTGVVTFVADANAVQGTKTPLTYQVTDITGQTAASTLTPIIPPPPTATNDTSTGAYDTNQTISPLTNDAAGTGATLVASSVKLCATTSTANTSCNLTTLNVPGEGTYTVNANGTVTFDPLPTFRGVATPVKYVVADTTGQLTNATITPTVAAPNAPVATSESKAVIPGGTATFTTLTGTGALATSGAGLNTSLTCLITPGSSPATCDSDGVVTIAGEGTYTLNTSTGVVTFVADANAVQGTKTPLTYQVTDITGQTATSTLTPVIPAPPVATNDTSSGAYDTNQTISILTNDTVTSPATLITSSIKLCATTSTANASCNLTTLNVPGEGTYTVNANGTVFFDPLPTFTGTASPVKYVVADSTGQMTSATITPTVSMPAAPVATPESKAVIPGGTAIFTTLTGTGALATSGVGLNTSNTCLYTPNTANCDADGIVTIAGEGTYTLNTSTGVVTFVADSNATQGTKTPITYKVTDIFGQTATSTLTPVIPAPPVATNDTSSGAYDTNQTISILTNDTVTSPAILVPTSVKLCATTSSTNTSCNLTTLNVPGEGTYTVNANGTVTFNPLPTFTGTASPVKYIVADSTGQVTNATITPTVSMPAAPVATPETKAVIPGGSVSFTTVTASNGLATSPVSFNTSGTCLITPNTTSCDADGIISIAGEGTYTLNTSTGVVTFVADVNATQGTKTPITYKVTDIFGQTATSTLTPVIPAPPSATNDVSSGPYDTNQTISILTNDNAASPATLVPTSVKLCATTSTVNSSCNLTTLTVLGEGTYTVNTNGTVTFDPLPTFTGTASPVKYIVADSTGQVTNATITPTVAVPPAPSATNNVSTGPFDTNQIISPMANDTFGSQTPALNSTLRLCAIDDPTTGTNEAETPNNCTKTSVTVAGEGTYTVNADGTVTFDPFPTFVGTAQTPVRYQVSDVLGRTVNATITPTVLPPPPPAALPQTLGVVAGGTVHFSQVKGSNGLVTGVGIQGGTTNGPCIVNPSTLVCGTTVTINGEGTWTIDQSTGIATFIAIAGLGEGTHTSVTYRVTDQFGQTATSTLTPVVPAAPRAVNDVSSGLVDVNQTLAPFKNDTFHSLAPVDVVSLRLCQPSTVSAAASVSTCTLLTVTVAGEGTYTVNANGTVTFDPLPTFSGVATVVPYEAINSLGQKVQALLTPTVLAAKVVDQQTSTKPSIPVMLSPFTLGSPSVGNTFVASTLKLYDPIVKKWSTKVLTEQGLWELKGSSVKFTPKADFTGTAVLPFRVNDSAGIIVRANLKVVVKGKKSLPISGSNSSLLFLMALSLIAVGSAITRRQ